MRIHLWFSLLVIGAFFDNFAQAEDEKDVEEAVSALFGNSSKPEDREFVKEVMGRVGELRMRRMRFHRKGGEITQEEKDKFRALVGPKSNETKEIDPEWHPSLKNVAVEGDIILNPQQLESLLTQESGSSDRKKRASMTNVNYHWDPNTPIYYTIDASLSSIRQKILDGVNFWQKNTCLKFQENSNGRNRLRFYRGNGCWSMIGKQAQWESQDVSIGWGCESPGTITHEIGHALGFYHTQSRYDRDNYITVDYGNVMPSLAYNFDKQTAQTETHFNLPYDYGSVMQYSAYAFAVNYDYPSSYAKNSLYTNMMGQRQNPSFSDVQEMNLLYNCAARSNSNLNCLNGGIPRPSDGAACICPNGYSGTYCDQLAQGNAPVCNGKIVKATSSNFESINATFGLGMTYRMSSDQSDCFWKIEAPSGRRLQLRLSSMTGMTCQEQCSWAGLELNIKEPQLRGMLLCCASAVTNKYFTTTTNVAMLRGAIRYNVASVNVEYRVV